MRELLKQAKKRLDRIDGFVFFGAGKDILKPKKSGRRIADFLNWLDYVFFSFLDYLDTKYIFKGRAIRTLKGRVRSRSERKLVAFFDNSKIKYVYEKVLVLGGIKLHPDFYLPEHDVYVEFWGKADSDARYQRNMRQKKAVYRKYQVPLISIYPRHLKSIGSEFPVLFKNATGRDFPERS